MGLINRLSISGDHENPGAGGPRILWALFPRDLTSKRIGWKLPTPQVSTDRLARGCFFPHTCDGSSLDSFESAAMAASTQAR